MVGLSEADPVQPKTDVDALFSVLVMVSAFELYYPSLSLAKSDGRTVGRCPADYASGS
ncbi:hypothetical protein [Rhodopirellula sp. SWK7]|uniref:hypothetical protein n=1 Tax=Rhodopirellula sp. SWK7 TaxID=595460 RepID=UPI0002C023EE|nr:hypothetical protein [Rhodopirellula sp. SWK7]EMI41778.1 hypothetical protein RRSWK_05593 [Rhodopirellula sp. SWK7]